MHSSKNRILMCIALLIASACAKSSQDPQIEELIKTRQPTFSGVVTKTFIVPSSGNNSISGECDLLSKGLEYSLGTDSNWVTIASGCSNGTFSITGITAAPILKVYVRAKTKTGYTPASIATVQLAIAPTAPLIAAVSSSRSDLEGITGTQNVMSYSFTNEGSSNGSVNAHFEAPGINYED